MFSLNFPFDEFNYFCLSIIAGPPKISEQVNGFRKAVQGRSIKLPCPVTGNPPPLIMWTKDGVTIHSGWERFRVRSEGLKVNDVVIEDSGSYICRATNGFGSVSVNFTLTITGEFSLQCNPARDDNKGLIFFIGSHQAT